MTRQAVIVWLNYNSKKMLNIVLESLRSIAELNYEDYRLLVIDNGSRDGSIEAIKSFIERNPELRHRSKVLELKHNLGFTGGHNVAWKYITRKFSDARYLVLVNNDAVLYRESLSSLTELLDVMPRTCGIQGVIEFRDTNRVDNFGAYMDELLRVYHFMALRNVSNVPRKCVAVTYVNGAYAIYKMDNLRKITLRNNDLFPTSAFAYLDDNLLGILAYLNNMNMVAAPVRAAKHYTSMTFRITGTREYLGVRSHIAKNLIIRTRYAPEATLYDVRTALKFAVKALRRNSSQAKMISRSVVDGVRLARRIKAKYGIKVSAKDVSRIPLINLNLIQALISLISARKLYRSIVDYMEKVLITKYGTTCI